MNATQMTIQLPQPKIIFLEEYAQRHKVTVAELIDQFINQLRVAERYSHHPEIEKFAGILPADIDAEKEYYDHIEEKHR
jgi:hypothetical protein